MTLLSNIFISEEQRELYKTAVNNAILDYRKIENPDVIPEEYDKRNKESGNNFDIYFDKFYHEAIASKYEKVLEEISIINVSSCPEDFINAIFDISKNYKAINLLHSFSSSFLSYRQLTPLFLLFMKEISDEINLLKRDSKKKEAKLFGVINKYNSGRNFLINLLSSNFHSIETAEDIANMKVRVKQVMGAIDEIIDYMVNNKRSDFFSNAGLSDKNDKNALELHFLYKKIARDFYNIDTDGCPAFIKNKVIAISFTYYNMCRVYKKVFDDGGSCYHAREIIIFSADMIYEIEKIGKFAKRYGL